MADLESPLLQSSSHNNCPGCKLQLRKESSKSPPKLELFYVAVLVLCNSLPISSLFPFVYFMVRDFNVAKTDKDIGFYAGYVGSSFMIGRFFTSTLWGWVADKYGRKVVFTVGTCSVIIFNVMFGFSTTFWMALVSRFLLGSFNGMLGPIRAYASEICREEHQALGLSMIGTIWGLGLVIGPALGGFFAQPSAKYPTVFPKASLFDKFPYALPCVIISIVALISLFAIIWLPESLHNHPLESLNVSEGSKIQAYEDSLDKESCKAGNKTNEEERTEKKSILRNRYLMAAISVYCIWALHDMAYTEVFSLWAVSPRMYGGLGLTTSDVGVILAISGASLLLFQLTVFPRLANLMGPIILARIPAVLSIPLVLVYPLFGRLHGRVLWVIAVCASVVKNNLASCVVTGAFLLINNSVPSGERGVANGLSLAGQSLFKAIGPASAGAIFSWCQKRLDADFLPGMWMLYFILSIPILLTMIVTFEPILPKSLNKPLYEEHTSDKSTEQDKKFERHTSFSF